MIDTIRLFSPNHSLIDLDYLNSKFGLTQSTYDKYYAFTAQLRNLELKYNSYGILIEGSAASFLKGNNIDTLKYNEIPTFIGELNELIKCNISNFSISRIDITDNLEMQHCPRLYKRYLGKCRYFQKVDYSHNGVQYINKVRKVTFYDKLLEFENKNKTVPVNYFGKKLLRYEYSIMDNRKYHLAPNICTVNDLFVPENYITLIDVWERMFNQIEKISFEGSVQMPYKPDINYRDYLQMIGAQANGGLHRTLTEIEELEIDGLMTTRQSTYLRKALIKNTDTYNELSDNAINKKEELEYKLKSKANENRGII